MTGGGSRDHVRNYYRHAARTGSTSCGPDPRRGASRYDADTLASGTECAAELSMVCGNPYAVADLAPGETVLDPAGVANAVSIAALIEELPLADASVDVVISNCVVNLAPDKTRVLAEIARVLRPGGRLAIADVVADNAAPPPDRAASAEWGAGALSHDAYLSLLADAGLTAASIEYTHDTGPGLHGAVIRAVA